MSDSRDAMAALLTGSDTVIDSDATSLSLTRSPSR